MHCLAACEEAQHIIKKAKYFPSSVPAPNLPHSRIGRQTNIRELYEAECTRDLKTGQPFLRSGSMLLEKLVARERLHTLIINLYPENKGYSVAVRTFVPTEESCIDSGPGTSTAPSGMLKEIPMKGEFSYKMDRLLRYIDNEELPYFMALTLELNYSHMFYGGCLIAEVRDYRQAHPRTLCDTHYVLLKPSTQTFHSDVNHLANKHDLNENDRRQLESKLLVKTIPLCLDPSPANAIVANKIQHERQLFNTLDLRKQAHSYSQVAINRKRKLTNAPRRGLELLESTLSHRARQRNSPTRTSTTFGEPNCPVPIPAQSLEYPPLKHPEGPIPVADFARRIDSIGVTPDAQPRPVDTFEKTFNDRDPEQKRVNHIKLTLFQRQSNLEYIGELYLDSDYHPGQSKGSACRFSLGPSCRHAYGYMNQFLEIFNETAPADVPQPPTVSSNIATPTGIETANATRGILAHLANGNPSGLVLLQGTQGMMASTSQISSNNLPILQSQLQATNQTRSHVRHTSFTDTTRNDIQQYQQGTVGTTNPSTSKSSSGNNATILSRLNSTPVNQNSAESTAVANAIINNSDLAIVHRTIAINQKTNPRNIASNSRIANRSAQILNNNSVNVNSLQQPVQINLSSLAPQLTTANVNQVQGQSQAFNITSINASNIGFAAVPLNSVNMSNKHMHNHNARVIAPSASSPGIKRTVPSCSSVSVNSDSRLHALLKGTAAADHHVEGANSDSGLLERIRASSGTSPVPSASPNQSPKSVMQIVTQFPKSTAGNSPLSSPPPQASQTAANTFQSLNLTQIANFPGHSNEYVQLQIPGIPQPIQLPISMSSAVSHAGVLLPIPVTSAVGVTSTNAHIMPNSTVTGASNATVVPFTILAQSMNKTNVRGGGAQQLQVVSALQRPRSAGSAQSSTRALLSQRTTSTPIRIATPNTNVTTVQTISTSNVAGNSIITLSGQPQQLQLAFQKQAQFQQFQQIQHCISQQQLQQRLNQQQKTGVTPSVVATKYRRRSNAADPNK